MVQVKRGRFLPLNGHPRFARAWLHDFGIRNPDILCDHLNALANSAVEGHQKTIALRHDEVFRKLFDLTQERDGDHT